MKGYVLKPKSISLLGSFGLLICNVNYRLLYVDMLIIRDSNKTGFFHVDERYQYDVLAMMKIRRILNTVKIVIKSMPI